MKKKFNITGKCIAAQHYMMDNSAKVAKVAALVQEGMYFAINRPRQYGKTTTLFATEAQLLQSEGFFPIRLNFQGIDEQWLETDGAFAQMFTAECIKYLTYAAPVYAGFLKQNVATVKDLNALSTLISDFVRFSPKKLVLLIDEVDASSNHQAFLSFLGMLRTKYLDRDSPHNFTFHSVVLAGVHDVKSLKYKIRDTGEAQYNSPWNIAIDFEPEMEFNPQEIAPMLTEYSQAEGVHMDIPGVAESLFYHTAGYPFLVSRLCQIVAEKVLPKKEKQNAWTLDDVAAAVQLIYSEVNTNFDSLIKNIQNHPDLYELVYDLLIEGEIIPFNPDNQTIRKGVIYGVFKQNGKLKIHNRIYEQRIYNYLTSNLRKNTHNMRLDSQFIAADRTLNFELILQRFQAHMQEHYSSKDLVFLEREWRLIFLAFLKPIINGEGHTFIEPEISEERRLDVVVAFGKQKHIVELKRWYGGKGHQRGLEQLCNYLDRQQKDTGYLVVFDHRREMVAKSEWIETKGKRIFAVWV